MNVITGHFSYYAKAYGGAFYAGLVYLMAVIAPNAVLGDITFVQWVGFAATIIGTGLGVGVITNGPKPGAVPPAGPQA